MRIARTMSVALCIAALAFAAGCEKMRGGATTEGGEELAATQQQTEGVGMPSPTSGTVETITVGSTPFSVEIATTDDEKAKGLMGRESLPDNSGMWFVFDGPVQEKFWMQGMVIPLDLIFVGQDMKVVHTIENAVPGSTELLTSPTPFQYVLEINAGKIAKGGIKVGDEVKRSIGQ
jgi:uncharacterized membrane protein (UPF0127 family)